MDLLREIEKELVDVNLNETKVMFLLTAKEGSYEPSFSVCEICQKNHVAVWVLYAEGNMLLKTFCNKCFGVVIDHHKMEMPKIPPKKLINLKKVYNKYKRDINRAILAEEI